MVSFGQLDEEDHVGSESLRDKDNKEDHFGSESLRDEEDQEGHMAIGTSDPFHENGHEEDHLSTYQSGSLRDQNDTDHDYEPGADG